MNKTTKWLVFAEVTTGSENRKTKIIEVFNKEYHSLLGVIKWYGGFRQYSFFPKDNIVFEKTCLQDITNVLVELMNERKLQSAVTQ